MHIGFTVIIRIDELDNFAVARPTPQRSAAINTGLNCPVKAYGHRGHGGGDFLRRKLRYIKAFGSGHKRVFLRRKATLKENVEYCGN